MAAFSVQICVAWIIVSGYLLGAFSAPRSTDVSPNNPWTNPGHELEVYRLDDHCTRWSCAAGLGCYCPGNEQIQFRNIQFCRSDVVEVQWCKPPFLPTCPPPPRYPFLWPNARKWTNIVKKHPLLAILLTPPLKSTAD